MSDISLIDTSNYKCYYSIDGTNDFKLYTATPNGNVEYTKYDTFTSADKTIIAFKELDPYSGDFNYIITRADEEQIIDAFCYDDILSYLSKDGIKEDDMYVVMGSKVVTTANAHPAVNFADRCDIDKYGPTRFHLEDGVRPAVTDITLFRHIHTVTTMLSVNGTAHVLYGVVPRLGDSFRDWPGVSSVAKTLTGVMKLIIEWASLADEPFNMSDEIAVSCKNYINTLKIPENVLNEISEYQEDMPVYRYLQNQENARHGFTEQTSVGPLFLNWIKKTHRYRTLNALVRNHPSPPAIPEEILLSEKQYVESKVYEICIKNDIDLASSPQEILAQIAPFTDLTLSQWVTDTNHVKSYIAYS